MNIVNAIKNNYGQYLAKTAGATALFFIARDAHTIGKLQADVTAQSRDANISMDLWENSQRTNSASLLQSEAKDKVFKYHLGSNTFSFFNSGIGYVKGFMSMFIDNVIPTALGATALFVKNKKISCGSAIALGVLTAFNFVKNSLGFGTTKFLQK